MVINWRLLGAGALALGMALCALTPRAAVAAGATIVPATKVVVFHPSGTRGATVSGACDMGESQALDRADAWRCIVGNAIYDPCFSSMQHATFVVCDASPTRPVGIRVNLPRALPTHSHARGGQPWILKLGDGSTCTFVTGATFGIGQERANYECSDKAWVAGIPTSGRVWLAVKAQLSSKVGPNGPMASRIWLVSVATLWK